MLDRKLVKKLYNYSLVSLGCVPYRNGWVKGDCPACGKELKFGVNPYQNRTNCFSCGYNPQLTNLIAKLQHLDSYNQVIKFLNDGDFDRASIDESEIETKNEIANIELPETFTLLMLGKTRYGVLARKWATERGFDYKELSMKGFGYCTDGKYSGYIIIPYYLNGMLVYFNARSYTGREPKYLNVSGDEVKLGKTLLLYNQEALDNFEKIYIVEGALNAETLGDNAVSSAGKHLSDNQISILIRAENVKTYIIMLDDDALDKAYELALRLVDFKRVKVVHFPKKKDVNDLGRARSKSLAMRSEYLTKSRILMTLKTL